MLQRVFFITGNHVEDRLLDQGQDRTLYTAFFWGCSRSITQVVVLDVFL